MSEETAAVAEFKKVCQAIFNCNNRVSPSLLQEDADYRNIPKLYKRHAELHKLLTVTYGYSGTQINTLM